MVREGVRLSKLSHRLTDLTGQSSGNMVVLGRAGSNRQGSSMWLCRCAVAYNQRGET